ncbi:hypothetical protein TD95_005046 [Thielaviopsis punctulata]|uniref:DNA mismatch repair protein S5 domain-containing protein n=1 Tax=Thielaviopsis punctulata TaxID=72032 RepID=A0A0F4ZG06_9PEZI|nr:hypothetical protein TD95_005046 [Thielaviopsis punctulata]
MPIKALPPETYRKFISSFVITSPDVLVKELVENSIDAGATSIEVLVSANTVDRIQVRDNGSGISQDDFDVLGRRSHTSKLTSYSELICKGGTTFGFRGEALASANTHGSVTITTRTKADKLASTISLVPKIGGVSLCKPTSGVFGTTVAVARLFGNLPVRRQQFTKSASKTLAKIKETLLRILMVRPGLKIVFKCKTGISQ